MRNRWFHKPVLHTADDHEKKVTWLELFYDLIFVAAIIQLGDALSDGVTRAHSAMTPFLAFAALYIPLWTAWTGFTFFANRFDQDDFAHRATVFVQMFAIGVMAIAAPRAMTGEHMFFPASVAGAFLVVALLYARAFKHNETARAYSRYWGAVFAIGGVVWGLSLLVPTPFNYFMWAAGVIAILAAPLNKHSRALAEAFPLDQEHLSERYGLLTIIVLGESFVKVLTYMSSSDYGLDPSYLLKAGATLTITCSVWWIYFDDVAGAHLKTERGGWMVWFYGHLPLAIGVTATGVAIKKTLGFDLAAPASDEYRYLLVGALFVTFVSVAIIDSVTQRKQAELSDNVRVNVRIGAAVLIAIMGPAGAWMPSAAFLGIVTAICFSQVIFDMFMAPLEETAELHGVETIAELSRRTRSGEIRQKRARASVDRIQNTIRRGTPSELRNDLYAFFMSGSWTRLILVLVGAFLLSNVFFAGLYVLDPQSISGEQMTFGHAFFFSVQTMSTIGFGALHPGTPYGDVVVTIEAAFGLLGVALATGLMFAKASRPRTPVLFSESVIVTQRHGKPTLSFRLGNARGAEIVDASLSVAALIDDLSPEGHFMRALQDLKLERDRTPAFSLTWSVFHVIDEQSPLWGHDLSEEDGALQAIIVTMLGHDSVYGAASHARHIYDPADICEGQRFVDVIHELPTGQMLIDYTKFHDTLPDEHYVKPPVFKGAVDKPEAALPAEFASSYAGAGVPAAESDEAAEPR